MGKTKNMKMKREKPKKSKKVRSKGRHGNAYYFVCFDAIKRFVSRMKKASNLIRQARRIETFKKVIKNKLAKV